MVRLAEPRDLPFLKHAWTVCFEDSSAFVDWNFRRNFSCSDTLIAEWEGQPASNMQLMPHRIRLRNMEYPVNYVSGVATLPKYRRRGLVRELFAFAFPEMCRRGEPISLLIPFDYGFYEKFGYKRCYTRVCRKARALPQDGLLGAEALGPELIRDLDGRYRRAMEPRTGYALRGERDWQKILEDLLLLSGGKILLSEDGYILATPIEQGGWELQEVCGPCRIPHRAEVKPFAMARILDPAWVLSDLAQGFSGRLRLRILDANIPQNNLTLEIGPGRVRPCREFDMEIEIGTLAQLVFGAEDDFTGSGLFPRTRPYLNMIF